MPKIISNRNNYSSANQVRSADLNGIQQLLVSNDDWIQVLTGYFSFLTANSIATSIDATTYFQVGDRIWIEQDGIDKYFFVIEVNEASISITAGSLYTFTSSSIEFLKFSRIVNPFGFPSIFTFDSTATVPVGTVTDQGIFTGQFFMIGRVVTVASSRIGIMLSDANVYMSETLPVDPSVSLSIQYGVANLQGGASGYLVSSIAGNGTAADNLRLDRIDASNFPAATVLNTFWNQTFLFS